MSSAVKPPFHEFIVARSPALLRVAYLLTGDQHRAEDLLQNALIKAASKWPTLEAPGIESYVRQVIYREHLSWWRRAARRPETLLAAPPEWSGTDEAATVDLRLTVRQALLRLTARQRAVLVLRYFEDLPEAQVAVFLDCSVGTVRSQTHRALGRLRVLAPELTTFQEAPS